MKRRFKNKNGPEAERIDERLDERLELNRFKSQGISCGFGFKSI